VFKELKSENKMNRKGKLLKQRLYLLYERKLTIAQSLEWSLSD
jgi:hypothetical protein